MGHRYGLRGTWVLRGVDLTLPARTLVRVEGGNGAGKSTLLRLLAGIDAPAEGRITGRRARTAYVPERFPAALPLTATGYLVHLGRIHGLRSAEAKRRAGEWLTRFGAADHARTPLAELSKGTSQKVAVAQALLAEPELLVLDEAWTGLDTAARAELDRAVAERVAAGATVVFVDHDPRRLAGAADLTLRTGGGGVHRVTAPAPTGPATGPLVLIEAVGPPGAPLPEDLPGDPARDRRTGAVPGLVRLTVPAPYSDAVLAALLTARPPWHIRQVAPAEAHGPAEAPAPGAAGNAVPAQAPVQARAPGAPEVPEVSEAPEVSKAPETPDPRGPLGPRGPRGARDSRGVRSAMTALLRYQAALLARSQRWLAPLLLYAAVLAVGVRSGQPVLGSLGVAAAAVLPVTAWAVHLCVAQEPPAARTVASAAAGPRRVHLAALLTATGCAAALAVVTGAVVLLISSPVTDDGARAVSRPSAALAGLLAVLCCVLLGAAVGALSTRPVPLDRGWSVAAAVLGSVLALVTTGSPARLAVTALVTGSRTGAVQPSVLPLLGAASLAAAAAFLVCRITARRG